MTSEERKVFHSHGDVAEPSRLGVLLDELLVLHQHVLDVAEAILFGRPQSAGFRGRRIASAALQESDDEDRC